MRSVIKKKNEQLYTIVKDKSLQHGGMSSPFADIFGALGQPGKEKVLTKYDLYAFVVAGIYEPKSF